MAGLFRAAKQPSRVAPGATSPNDAPQGTQTQDVTTAESDPGAAVVDPVAAVPNEADPVAPASGAVAAVPNEVAPVTDPVAPASDTVAAVPNEAAPGSDAVAPLAVAPAAAPSGTGSVPASPALPRLFRPRNCLPTFLPYCSC